MAIFDLLKLKLQEDIIFSRFSGKNFRIESVDILTEKTVLCDRMICISNEKTASSIIQTRKSQCSGISAIFLVSAQPSKNRVLQELSEKYNLNIIMASRSENELNLAVTQAMNYYLSASRFFKKLWSCQDMVQVINQVSKFLGEEALVMNSFGNLVYQTANFNTGIKAQITRQFHDICSGTDKDSFDRCRIGNMPETPFIYVKLWQSNFLYGILFITTSNHTIHDYRWLLKHLFDCLTRLIYSDTRTNPNVPPRFSIIWKEIMDKRFSSSEELRNRFLHSGYRIDTFSRLMVVQMNQPTEQLEYLYLQLYPLLKNFFPDSQITLYLGTIVILNWEAERNYNLSLSPEIAVQLEELLKKYNSYICVGWGTRDMSWLPALYNFSHKVLYLHYQIEDKYQESRIIHYGNYCPMLITDLCVQHARTEGSTKSVMLLCHPAVINLYRYDLKHKTNLENTLFHYLINHHSLEQTAASLFMHRNTVVNKLRKIKELVSMDLTAPENQPHLIFSHYVLHYCISMVDPGFVTTYPLNR